MIETLTSNPNIPLITVFGLGAILSAVIAAPWAYERGRESVRNACPNCNASDDTEHGVGDRI